MLLAKLKEAEIAMVDLFSLSYKLMVVFSASKRHSVAIASIPLAEPHRATRRGGKTLGLTRCNGNESEIFNIQSLYGERSLAALTLNFHQ